MKKLLVRLWEKDWFIALWSGVAVTIIGVAFTMRWETHRMRSESLERDRIMMNAIHEELLANKKSAEQNLAWLQHELEILSQDKVISQPLVLMKTGFWDLAKVNLSRELLVDDRLERLRNLGFLTEYVNEAIRSRENYRIHNEGMSNYRDRLQTTDELLVSNLQDLLERIAAYEAVYARY